MTATTTDPTTQHHLNDLKHGIRNAVFGAGGTTRDAVEASDRVEAAFERAGITAAMRMYERIVDEECD